MRSEEEMVAYALEIAPALLPYAPALLADLELARAHPEIASELMAFSASQDAEYAFLSEHVTDAVWVLQRS